MISNSLPPEEEFLFSNPEWLEQLRLELLALAQQDQCASQLLQADLSALLSSPDSALLPLDLLREADFQLR